MFFKNEPKLISLPRKVLLQSWGALRHSHPGGAGLLHHTHYNEEAQLQDLSYKIGHFTGYSIPPHPCTSSSDC